MAFSSRFAALSSSVLAALCRTRFRTVPPPVCLPQFPLINLANASSGTSRSSHSLSVHGTPSSISLVSFRFTRCRIRSIVTWSNQPFRSCDAEAFHSTFAHRLWGLQGTGTYMYVICAMTRVVDVRANQWVRNVTKLERARPSWQCLAVKDVHLSKARLATIT